MTVYTIAYPGWSSKVVCQSIDDVLEIIKYELSESEPGFWHDFSIEVEEMSQEELAALQPFEWD